MGLIDRNQVALFIPPGLRRFKLDLFEQIGRSIGRVIRYDHMLLDALPDDIVPIVGCSVQLGPQIDRWRKTGRKWIYWDRGYLRRYFHTWMPTGSAIGIPRGFYRWHIGRAQMDRIHNVPADRWNHLRLADQMKPWNKNGRSIVVINTMQEYFDLWLEPDWIQRTVNLLKCYTDRPIIVRSHESKKPLYEELKTAHCLVTHGSVAAVESVIWGCPVFVTDMSAAKLVGLTDFSKIETPVYPERQPWLNSLAYCQYSEAEIINGTVWKMIQ